MSVVLFWSSVYKSYNIFVEETLCSKSLYYALVAAELTMTIMKMTVMKMIMIMMMMPIMIMMMMIMMSNFWTTPSFQWASGMIPGGTPVPPGGGIRRARERAVKKTTSMQRIQRRRRRPSCRRRVIYNNISEKPTFLVHVSTYRVYVVRVYTVYI